MQGPFETIDAAFTTLSNPEDPRWADAFGFLAQQPETAQLVMETFRETLEQMGVEPTGRDPSTGEPSYSLADVARAMGVPADELEDAMSKAAAPPGQAE